MKERLLYLAEYLGLSVRAFEVACGLQRGNISNMSESGAIGSDKLSKIFDKHPNINLEWLLTGNGEMLKTDTLISQPVKLQVRNTLVAEPISEYERNIISIPIVDVSAAAGYGRFNSNNPEKLGEITFPANFLQKKYGNYYCGRVNGESMIPTLLYNDWIIFRLLTPTEWSDIKNDDIYFIVNRAGESIVKRVYNKLGKEGLIIALSDNPDRRYKDIPIHADDIANIYHVEWRFSNDMTNINQMYYSRLDTLEEQMKSIQEIIKKSTK